MIFSNYSSGKFPYWKEECIQCTIRMVKLIIRMGEIEL